MPQTNIDHKAYPTSLGAKTDQELHYIIDDCRQALLAMPESDKAGYYADEIAYCSNELALREKSRKPTLVTELTVAIKNIIQSAPLTGLPLGLERDLQHAVALLKRIEKDQK